MKLTVLIDNNTYIDEYYIGEEHKEKIAEYSKNYYEQNKEKQKEYYTKKNAEEETKLRKIDRKSTRLNSSHWNKSRMPSSA